VHKAAAVALRSDETECDPPYIVARGRKEDALAIRTEARALRIPAVRDISEEVPEELLKAAAAVLRVALKTTEADASQLADSALFSEER
jgi:type III secretion protein U